ncbi:prepilin peptidase (plasmid) [Rhodobacteraceae bacterium M382]|nr:prepilin peptidase [Rhodobacteraceae bacterium M382]
MSPPDSGCVGLENGCGCERHLNSLCWRHDKTFPVKVDSGFQVGLRSAIAKGQEKTAGPAPAMFDTMFDAMFNTAPRSLTGSLTGPLSLLILLISPAVGSFLGVLADRLPRGESVIRPHSACRRCGARLTVPDLIPVLSYALLRGALSPLWRRSGPLASLYRTDRHGAGGNRGGQGRHSPGAAVECGAALGAAGAGGKRPDVVPPA